MSVARCPVCKKEVIPGGPSRPFCSPRCKEVDLGRWFNEEYRITRPLEAEDLVGDSFELGAEDAGNESVS